MTSPFIPLILEFLLLYTAAFGLLLAPIAGMTNGLVERLKGLSAWKYGAVGAFYCALIILPWLHLTAQLAGKNLKCPALFQAMFSYMDCGCSVKCAHSACSKLPTISAVD